MTKLLLYCITSIRFPAYKRTIWVVLLLFSCKFSKRMKMLKPDFWYITTSPVQIDTELFFTEFLPFQFFSVKRFFDFLVREFYVRRLNTRRWIKLNWIGLRKQFSIQFWIWFSIEWLCEWVSHNKCSDDDDVSHFVICCKMLYANNEFCKLLHCGENTFSVLRAVHCIWQTVKREERKKK